MAATIGTGTTAKFPAAVVYPMDVLSISMSGLSRETVPVSHLSSTPAMDFLETELYDPGEITLELHLDSTAPSIPGVIDNIHGTLLINFAGGGSWSCLAKATGFEWGVPLEDKMTAQATFKLSGAITIA